MFAKSNPNGLKVNKNSYLDNNYYVLVLFVFVFCEIYCAVVFALVKTSYTLLTVLWKVTNQWCTVNIYYSILKHAFHFQFSFQCKLFVWLYFLSTEIFTHTLIRYHSFVKSSKSQYTVCRKSFIKYILLRQHMPFHISLVLSL